LKAGQKNGFFDAPFDLFKAGTMNFFEENVKHGRNRSKFQKTVFYKQILDFHCPYKILYHTSNYEILSKSLVPNTELFSR